MTLPTIPTIITILGFLFMVAGALAVIRSKYRDGTDTEREKYIVALEARNKLLEETNERQRKESRERDEARVKEMRQMERRHHNLEGKFCFLQDLVLRQCKHAEIDPTAGGCKNCAVGMCYGQGGS